MKITPSARFTAIVEVEPVERRLLAGLFSDAAELLGGDDAETEADELAILVGMSSGERPTDPAVLRLLPDVDAEDSERATEFRRLTERDIRESKLANFRTALFTLDRSGRAELTEEQARAWATALGDVRLILATRLGIATESDLENLLETLDEQPESTVMTVNVYELLTWAQDRITTILLEALPDLGEDDEAGGNDLGNEGP
ncbi:hypothetical protein HMPREF0183_2361 [Brevibacterium mcbrellneri ATCC 49030]|uniref:Uncharacterized protein n=1 Tax=Brevibacterium mcbrellneri ATCC 49030 TaxID=585530 RepID=D4YR01_9MICO|nr:DUF2017 domain-containing protein [Brevibacterium mcbrellneri]EFG46392.1 hypothetical protein HMPREF0183_2361 [Brevibacterium mcbrellneri ATCC 49030]